MTVIRAEEYNRISDNTFKPTQAKIRGIGSSVHTLGKFNATISIDDNTFEIECSVVDGIHIPFQMIVGMDLLTHANLNYNADGITITKRYDEKK